VLGAVLFGIGWALVLEARRPGSGGLGMRGAIAINLCGALAVLAWLVTAEAQLPVSGVVTLAAVAGVVLLLAGIEMVARGRRP